VTSQVSHIIPRTVFDSYSGRTGCNLIETFKIVNNVWLVPNEIFFITTLVDEDNMIRNC